MIPTGSLSITSASRLHSSRLAEARLPDYSTQSACRARPRLPADRNRIARLAVASLHAELVCFPKPGLVTPFDTGSHNDMDAATFMRSLFALRSYYVAIAQAGTEGAPFPRLQRLGIEAEAEMNRATSGINTHRGAIFNLGLLVAAASSLRTDGAHIVADEVCDEVRTRWGREILATQSPQCISHGQWAARRYGAGGARREAADGFPALRTIAVPTLRRLLCAGMPTNSAMVQTLMTLMATIDDTNLLHRGGESGLSFARERAREFLHSGGITTAGWGRRLARVGRDLVSRHLSPGGSADLLACAWFLVHLERQRE